MSGHADEARVSDVPLIPARMLNEFVYCPRLAFLEWVECEFADNVFTVEGRHTHRKVDKKEEALPEASDHKRPDSVSQNTPSQGGDTTHTADESEDDDNLDIPCIHARSVMLSSDSEGLIARIDLVEATGDNATPVEYKRGKVPDIEAGVYDPERVQLCAQGLILRSNGYRCDSGVVYFAASKQRVTVAFDDDLVTKTRDAANDLRSLVLSNQRPAPLEDSPRCPHCSLVGICLPDETWMLNENSHENASNVSGNPCEGTEMYGVRRLLPARDDALPLYVQQHGMYVGKKGDELVVKEKKSPVAHVRFLNTSQVNLFGNVGMSAAAINECCSRDINVCHFSHGGWFYGITRGMGLRNAETKRLQFRAADNPALCLSIARRFVWAKIANQRTMLRRNHPEPPAKALAAMADLISQARQAQSMEALLGIEGMAAKYYFGNFGALLKNRDDNARPFDFTTRNRRPPKDPINAMLSLLYSLLSKDCTVTLLAVGFDPWQGFMHQPRFGRPALALDLMEEFRPIVADSAVLSAVNNRIVHLNDFIDAAQGVALKSKARKAVIESYERRLDTLVTHPVFGYRISYRRVLEVQTRLLSRYLSGELDEYPAFTPR